MSVTGRGEQSIENSELFLGRTLMCLQRTRVFPPIPSSLSEDINLAIWKGDEGVRSAKQKCQTRKGFGKTANVKYGNNEEKGLMGIHSNHLGSKSINEAFQERAGERKAC